jgi:hypothetical protein
MRRMDERELFAQRFDDIDPDALWAALKRALATMDRLRPDDTTRIARFSTGTSATSWGQHHLAEVTETAPSGSTLTVRGRPKASFLTTNWGEKRHAHGVERQLIADVEVLLQSQASATPPGTGP